MFKKLLGLLSDAAIYGMSSALSQIISLFLLPLFTQKLSTGEMGILLLLGSAVALAILDYPLQGHGLGVRITYALVISVVYPVLAFLLLARSRDERQRMAILLARFGFGPSRASSAVRS